MPRPRNSKKEKSSGRNPGSRVSGSKLNWHSAFFQAIQRELADYKDALEFRHEYQLTAEPLRIDMVIIKKPPALAISKNIARIFRAENLVEYKSPGDYLSVRDFHKVYAYANLYAAITPGIRFSDLTITFVEKRHPRELIRYLTNERHYTIEEPWPGIHLVQGDYLPIQIIESKKLSPRENLWLKSLSDDLETEEAHAILREDVTQDIGLDAYLQILYQANSKSFWEATEMPKKETFEEFFTKVGLIPEWLERGREQGAIKIAQNLLKEGMSVEKTAKIAELPVEKVRSLKLPAKV
ncbi:hypothetical protein TREPR_3179 [Treponema primitia ZAS-2]|uniref:Uncharacterized protein n=1 Tax=Treponema primitia (strain ATCC BAA-887 / DSM 12427 / ZAS-2) TaxID=545694 RepID=F5YLQ1_TREPZ|nr:hypothetical protein [Treponema primitia]AEF84669.1 hypothetical protein TREPR_3179 [Treponema primitia ZAS-2]